MARVRHHVNPLKGAFWGKRPPPVAGEDLEVEIGCADAQFLFERAAADPARRYVGIEIREDHFFAVWQSTRSSVIRPESQAGGSHLWIAMCA